MTHRTPSQIIHNGQRLSEALEAHKLWLDGHCDGKRIDLRGANLRGANLQGADLQGANGNMIEVKSAQFDTWPLTWTTSPSGEVILQIGCQRHSFELWEKSDPRWIAALDDYATEWWSKYRDAVLSLVKASPATPYGKAKQ